MNENVYTKSMLALHHIHHHKNHRHTKNKLYGEFLDILIYFIALVGPVFSIPQIYLIWHDKNAEGLSLITWVSYTLFSVGWLLYGIAHKAKPIVASNIIWIIINGSIVVGILVYGKNHLF